MVEGVPSTHYLIFGFLDTVLSHSSSIHSSVCVHVCVCVLVGSTVSVPSVKSLSIGVSCQDPELLTHLGSGSWHETRVYYWRIKPR